MPIPLFQSTKSGFLCAFGVWNPCFQTFRAQIRGFCAFLAFGTRLFGHFEHKIGVFVLFWPLKPLFSGISSTKSAFLCSRGGESGIGKRNRGDAYYFAAAPTPSHQHTSTRTPTPAHQHQRTSTSAPAAAPQQWYQALSSAVLAPCSAVHAPLSAIWCRVMPSSTLWYRLGAM